MSRRDPAAEKLPGRSQVMSAGVVNMQSLDVLLTTTKRCNSRMTACWPPVGTPVRDVIDKVQRPLLTQREVAYDGIGGSDEVRLDV